MSEEPNLREQTDHHAVALISGEDACGAMARLFMPRQSEDTGIETWTNRDTCFWIL